MKKIFLSLLILITHFSYGQEMWGISNSNYSGNMGIFLNPSTIVGAPYKYEINIVAADFFAENSYIYFPQDKHIVWNSITGNNEPGKNYSYRTGVPLKKVLDIRLLSVRVISRTMATGPGDCILLFVQK